MSATEGRVELPDRIGLWLARIVSKVRLPEWAVIRLTQPTVDLFVPIIAERDRFREALLLIAGDIECENFTRPPYCRDQRSNRHNGSVYGAERCCDVCIARAALDVTP